MAPKAQASKNVPQSSGSVSPQDNPDAEIVVCPCDYGPTGDARDDLARAQKVNQFLSEQFKFPAWTRLPSGRHLKRKDYMIVWHTLPLQAKRQVPLFQWLLNKGMSFREMQDFTVSIAPELGLKGFPNQRWIKLLIRMENGEDLRQDIPNVRVPKNTPPAPNFLISAADVAKASQPGSAPWEPDTSRSVTAVSWSDSNHEELVDAFEEAALQNAGSAPPERDTSQPETAVSWSDSNYEEYVDAVDQGALQDALDEDEADDDVGFREGVDVDMQKGSIPDASMQEAPDSSCAFYHDIG